MEVRIYGLYDPRTDVCRYVGKTKVKLLERLKGHIRDAKRRKHSVRRFSWVLSLLAANTSPEIRELELVTEETWRDVEKQWIAKFRAAGVDLVNTTDGGDGASGMRHSAETRARISASSRLAQASPEVRAERGEILRKKYADPEMRRKMSALGKVSHNTAEYKAKASALFKEIWNRPEKRAQRSAALKGRILSPEWRAKISATKTGMKKSEAAIAKSIAWHTGRKRSPETRARMIVAANLREQRKREARIWP